MPVDSTHSFVEALVISMSGCGVGYSVERQYVEQFPRIRRQTVAAPRIHVIEDSSEGWGQLFRLGITTWFEGADIKFDYSEVRPAAPYSSRGGAPGSEPLRQMFVRPDTDFGATRGFSAAAGCSRHYVCHWWGRCLRSAPHRHDLPFR